MPEPLKARRAIVFPRWVRMGGLLLASWACHDTGATITPKSLELAVGLSRQLTIEGRIGNYRSTERLDPSWSSTDTAVAGVHFGVVTGLRPGTARIVGAVWGAADTVTVTVVATRPPAAAFSLSPRTIELPSGTHVRFTTTTRFTDSSETRDSSTVRWRSTSPSIVSISGGVAETLAPGAAEVIATSDDFEDTARITVHPPVAPEPVAFPLRIGDDPAQLVDQQRRPFLLVGDAAWSMIAQLDRLDAETYLATRQLQGFNTVIISLLERKFAARAPANIHGIAPFQGQPFGTPDERYFALADTVLQAAARRGMLVLLAPLYLGNKCGNQGWCTEILGSSDADLEAWGRFVGARYRSLPNLVWVIGGDTDPAPVRSRVLAFVEGLRQEDSVHLVTAHNAPEQMAAEPWVGQTWLTVNDIYTYRRPQYAAALAASRLQPVRPFFLIESGYENDNGVTPEQLRAQSYWTVLAGGMGHVFGNCPMWSFGAAELRQWCDRADWKAELSSVGSRDMGAFRRLFQSRHWYRLTPDTSQRVIVSGAGTPGTPDFVLAATTRDSSSVLAYLPTARTLTVRGDALADTTMVLWWFQPGSGESSRIGRFSTAAPQTVVPPSEGDWVLVMDAERFGFPAP